MIKCVNKIVLGNILIQLKRVCFCKLQLIQYYNILCTCLIVKLNVLNQVCMLHISLYYLTCCCHNSSHWKSIADALCHSNHVRYNPMTLETPEVGSCSPKSSLDLVWKTGDVCSHLTKRCSRDGIISTKTNVYIDTLL